MTFFEAVVQGIIQGLTEFLPVSSSGHLLISQHILGVNENNLFFDVMLHIGTLLAVFAVYYRTIWKLILAFFEIIKMMIKKEFKFRELNTEQNMVIALFFGLLPLLLLFVPVPGSGTNVKGVAEGFAELSSIIPVGIALIVTAFVLKIGIEKQNSYKMHFVRRVDSEEPLKCFDGKKKIGIIDAIYIGIAQLIAAIFPGISRSGSTLSAGLMRSVNKQTALDYSFILGIPAIIAAALLELKDVLKSGIIDKDNLAPILVGMLVSAIVGFLAIKLFRWLLKTDKMMIFVIYVAVLGICSTVVGIIEKICEVNIFTGLAI